jgi:hypothetical protein
VDIGLVVIFDDETSIQYLRIVMRTWVQAESQNRWTQSCVIERKMPKGG